MADQASTPTSGADSSIAGGGTNSNPNKPSTSNPSGSGPGSVAGSSAPKDKACPFCGQPFTSSSLGRHLDLYIKEKNPKPADGLHDVDEIRKLRGAITRRQPRGSSGRREGSTPAGTPGGTPGVGGTFRGGESEMGTPSRTGSGSGSKAGVVQRQPMTQEKGKVMTALNQVNWQSTGVINNIPIMHQRNDLNGGTPGLIAAGSSEGTPEGRRTVSRQIAAKNTFDQKQKMLDAMEGQRAAELALREILGSIKAAMTVAQPALTASPFDFDPLSLTFPSLVLTCLPPPPTISQITPIAHPSSWFTDPPSQTQLKALSTHFREKFHNATVMRTLVASTPPHPDDVLYAHHAAPEVQAAISQQAKQYEDQVTAHLHQAYQQWLQTPPASREELWKLELARFVGQKSAKVTQLEQLLESVQQENAHLKSQVESLSRLQNPKEFAASLPQTLSLNRREAVKLAELGMRGRSTGFRIGDTEESLQQRVEQVVERWKPAVRRTRAGMQQQRSLSGQMRPGQSMGEMQNGMPGQQMNGMTGGGQGMDLDGDAELDADADAEVGQENYNQAQAQMQQQQQDARSGNNTPIMQQHMIQAGYPNINQQQQAQQQNLRGQQNQVNQQNINGLAMMNLQQQHAAAQQAAQQQQMQAQNQGQQQAQMQNQGQQMGQGQGAQQMGGQQENGAINGQHQNLNQAQQQMAAMRRQQHQQQQQQSGVAAQMNGRPGGRVNVPF